MLQQILNLFRTSMSLDSWEESHVEKLINELHPQLEYLEAFMGLEAEQKGGTLSKENFRLQVKMYFQRIHDYLENQEHSSCACTIVQVDAISTVESLQEGLIPNIQVFHMKMLQRHFREDSMVEVDFLEVPLHSQCRALSSQGRFLLSHRLHQTGVQVFQLPMESSAESVQEGGVPGSRGALCVEEVEDLLEHLVEDRDGLGLLELAAIHHLLGEPEVFSVPQTEERGDSPHLAQKHEVFPANLHVVLRQETSDGPIQMDTYRMRNIFVPKTEGNVDYIHADPCGYTSPGPQDGHCEFFEQMRALHLVPERPEQAQMSSLGVGVREASLCFLSFSAGLDFRGALTAAAQETVDGEGQDVATFTLSLLTLENFWLLPAGAGCPVITAALPGAPATSPPHRVSGGPEALLGVESAGGAAPTRAHRALGPLVESDSFEVPPHSQDGVVLIRQRSLFRPHLGHHTGSQVIQLLIKAIAQSVQEGRIPSSRSALRAEEAEGLLDPLVDGRDGLSLLQLLAVKHLPGECEDKREVLLICSRSAKALLLPRLWVSGRSHAREQMELQLSTSRASGKAKGRAIGDRADAAGLAQVESDSFEVPPHSQDGVVLIRQRSLFRPHLGHHTGSQVIQLLIKAIAQSVQEGRIPSSRSALRAEEAEGLLDPLVDGRDGLSLLQLLAVKHLPGECEDKREVLLICSRSAKALLLPRLWVSGRSHAREQMELQLSTSRASGKAKGRAIGDRADAAGLAQMEIDSLEIFADNNSQLFQAVIKAGEYFMERSVVPNGMALLCAEEVEDLLEYLMVEA
ncbi:hypothetical protein MC885_019896, partial [Smutsia gigantea]